MPPATASTATTEPADDDLPLDLGPLGLALAFAAQPLPGRRLRAWLFRLLMLVFSMWDAHLSYAGYVSGE